MKNYFEGKYPGLISYIDGTSKSSERADAVKRFTSSSYKINGQESQTSRIFISTDAGEEGITLAPWTSLLISYTPSWHPPDQRAARVWRLSADKDKLVEIKHYQMAGSIDKKIRDLHRKKLTVLTEVFNILSPQEMSDGFVEFFKGYVGVDLADNAMNDAAQLSMNDVSIAEQISAADSNRKSVDQSTGGVDFRVINTERVKGNQSFNLADNFLEFTSETLIGFQPVIVEIVPHIDVLQIFPGLQGVAQ